MDSRLRLPLLACLLAVAAACDSSSPTGGSGGSRTVAAGEVVTGEITAANPDAWYDVTPPPGPFQLLLQARSGSAADTLVAELVDGSRVAVAVASAGTDSVLEAQSSSPVSATPGVHWRVHVHGRSAGDTGPFALSLFARSDGPEHVSPTIATGQLVEGEPIDVDGDVDVFRLSGHAGQQVILFGQPRPGERRQVTFELVDSAADHAVARVVTASPSQALEEWSSGRVVLPSTGTYLVRVKGSGGERGPYRFRVDAIDPAPETGSAAQAVGNVVTGAIESVGDVDEYTFDGHAGQEMNLLVQLVSGMSLGGLRVELRRGNDQVAAVVATTPAASLDQAGTGRIALPADGPYLVRVYGTDAGAPERATGSYRLELYPVNRAPESGVQLRPDGPVVSEAVDHPGDVDEFPFTGTGQLTVFHVETPPGDSASFIAEILDAAGQQCGQATTTPSGGEGYRYSHRCATTTGAPYRLRVQALPFDAMRKAPYTLELYTVNPAPEHVPATVQVGQTVTGEVIDRPGDLDVFTVTGQAREVNLFVGMPDPGPLAASFEPVNNPLGFPAVLLPGPMSLDAPGIGRLQMSAVNYTLRVDPGLSSSYDGAAWQGAYAFRVFPIDRRPEGRAAAYTPGDTVSGEPVYPAGDVDEYTFSLAVPTPLHVYWAGWESRNAGFAQLRSESTRQVLWTSNDRMNGAPVADLSLPAGRYTVIIAGVDSEFSPAPRQEPARIDYAFALIPR